MARGRRARRGRARRNRWGRWIGRGVVVVVILAVLGLLGSYLWLKSFLGSEKFREMADIRVGEALGVEAHFSSFEWDGMEVRVPRFEAEGEELVRRIAMEDLVTEVRFSSLLKRKVETPGVHVRRLRVELDAAGESPEVSSGDDSLDVGGFEVGDFSGEIRLRDGAVKWGGMRASFSGRPTAGSYDITLNRGSFSTPLSLFPDPRLVEAKLRYNGGSLFVTRSDWRVYESGRLSADGEVRLRNGAYAIDAILTKVLCQEMLPDDWKKRLRGELSSEFTVEGEGRKAPVITGDLEIKRGHLTALPVLDRIAAYTDTERFRRLALRQASLSYRQEGERLELTNIVLASEGLVRIEGHLSIVGDQLDGSFQVGVPPGTLARIPGAETKVFMPGKSGMLWAPVTVTGTKAHPREDLSDRLFAAAGARMIELIAGEAVLKHSGRPVGELAEGIIQRTKDAAEVGARVIDGGREALEGGVIEGGTNILRDGVGSILGGILGTPEPVREPAGAPGEEVDEEARKAGEETEGPREGGEGGDD